MPEGDERAHSDVGARRVFFIMIIQLTEDERAAVDHLRSRGEGWWLSVATRDTLLALLDRLLAPAPGWSADEERFLARCRTAVQYEGGWDNSAVVRLLGMIDTSQAIMADYLADGQALREEGAREERLRCLDRVWAHKCGRGIDNNGIAIVMALGTLYDDLESLPPLPPPSPPSVARRRADAMEACLREWVEAARRLTIPSTEMLDDTRRLLGMEGHADE